MIRARDAEQSGERGPTGMGQTLRMVLRERSVAIPVTVSAVVASAAIIDEYVPLLARNRGLDDTFIPLVFLSVWVGLLIGGEIAARQPTIRSRSLAGFVTIGGATALVGLLTDPVWTLPLIGVSYAAIEATWVVSDARLQARVPTHIRATVASVRGLGVALVIGLAVLAIAIMSSGDDPTPGLVVVAVALIATSPLVARLPPPERDR